MADLSSRTTDHVIADFDQAPKLRRSIEDARRGRKRVQLLLGSLRPRSALDIGSTPIPISAVPPGLSGPVSLLPTAFVAPAAKGIFWERAMARSPYLASLSYARRTASSMIASARSSIVRAPQRLQTFIGTTTRHNTYPRSVY
jgi:hypothetical protein